jgi:two-component system response regulator MprA
MAERRPRILVVEDDPRLVMALEDSLIAEGYDVAVARNGRDAIASLAKSMPALVILDVDMPGMDGREFMAWRKTAGVTVPVILATCADDVNPAALGAAGRISKPYDLDTLLEVIETVVPRP